MGPRARAIARPGPTSPAQGLFVTSLAYPVYLNDRSQLTLEEEQIKGAKPSVLVLVPAFVCNYLLLLQESQLSVEQ